MFVCGIFSIKEPFFFRLAFAFRSAFVADPMILAKMPANFMIPVRTLRIEVSSA